MSLRYSFTCFEHYYAHHQEVKIVLYSIWYHHTCRCDDTRSRDSEKFTVVFGTLGCVTVWTTGRHLLPYFSHINPVDAVFPYFLKAHFKASHPANTKYSRHSSSIRTSKQNPLCISLLPHACYMLRSSHTCRDHPKSIYERRNLRSAPV